ncbi:MAG: zinc ABC transporter substrate-binding protein [Simkaniaceae bacterium]|nr:zinc ABC transporter substrate-binding protein [Simkaniaceae bacterium]
MWRVVLLVCFLSCTPSPQGEKLSAWMGNSPKIKVLSTIAMIDDLVKQVGGEYVDTLVLIQGEIDPHSYTLVKGDDEKFEHADLIFYNGLGLEHGASLSYRLQEATYAVALGERISPESLIRVGGEVDPHIWMDVRLFSQVVEPIAEALAEIDPVHKEIYLANAETLKKTMLLADQRFEEILTSIQEEKRYLVTTHDAFHYFVRRYFSQGEDWMTRCRAPEGLAPDGQMSVQSLSDVVNHLLRYQISVVFPETNVNAASLQKIVGVCKEKGQTVRLAQTFLLGDSMGDKRGYLEMMEYNVAIIQKELSE